MPSGIDSDRALGAYLGLAVGDALGATVEFMDPKQIQKLYGVHREIVGGGWLGLPAGAVTDDTEMALAMGDAIVQTGGFELRAVADAFGRWLRGGPRDCGMTCARGIERYLTSGQLSGPPSARDGGNGAVMRNLPVVLCSLHDPPALRERTLAQCHITHHHPQSDAAALCLADITRAHVLGASLTEVMAYAEQLVVEHPPFAFRQYTGRATAYVVDTVCTVLRAFTEAADFESAVVQAVNRGDDADTTGALTGMLAGARFGASAIPSRWLQALDPKVVEHVTLQTQQLVTLAGSGR